MNKLLSAAQSAFRGGGYTDFSGLQPLIEKYRAGIMAKQASAPAFGEWASKYCRSYASDLSGTVGSLLTSLAVAIRLARSGTAASEEPKRAFAELERAVDALSKAIMEKANNSKQAADGLRYDPEHLGLPTHRIALIAEYAVGVSLNHYTNSPLGAVKLIANMAQEDKIKSSSWPAYSKMLDDQLERIRANIGFMAGAQASQIFFNPYLADMPIPMIIFPTDPEYAKAAAARAANGSGNSDSASC